MSYCRWSDDDYQCDVYCYQSEGGFETWIAGRRYVFPEPLPEKVNFHDDPTAWFARHQKIGDMLDSTKMEPIGLPLDGQDFRDGTADECVNRLILLREMGYNVPQHAIDSLLEEAGQP